MHDREGIMHANVRLIHAYFGVMHASVLESGVIDCFLFLQMNLMGLARIKDCPEREWYVCMIGDEVHNNANLFDEKHFGMPNCYK